MITFKYNKDKALNVVLWFIKRHGGKINKLKLIKLVFYADRSHLLGYGRPIIGGQYYALPHGPVLSELKNDIENETNDTPFSVHKYDVEDRAVAFDEEQFSQSDLEVLEDINNQYGTYDKWKLRNMTHELRCYLKNEPKERTSNRLPYEDFFLDAKKSSMLERIKDHQAAMADFL